MTPLFISKATSNLSAFTDFYTAALGASVTYRQDMKSVLRSAFFNVGFDSMAGHMSVRAVERQTWLPLTSARLDKNRIGFGESKCVVVSGARGARQHSTYS